MAVTVQAPFDIELLRAKIVKGEWTIDLLWPYFRQALISKLSNAEVPHDSLPTWLLTARYYRKTYPSKCPKLQCNATLPIQVFDRTSELSAYWDEACKGLIENGQLGTLNEIGQAHLSKAFKEIFAIEPNLESLFRQFVNTVVIYSGVGTPSQAASQPHFAGCLFLHEDLLPQERLPVSIVHELAHQEIFGLNLIDRLVSPSADSRMAYAPLQLRDRPTIGRLHAAHALFRMIQYQRKTNSEKLFETQAMLFETISTFQENDLTEFGTFLIREVYPQYCGLERMKQPPVKEARI